MHISIKSYQSHPQHHQPHPYSFSSRWLAALVEIHNVRYNNLINCHIDHAYSAIIAPIEIFAVQMCPFWCITCILYYASTVRVENHSIYHHHHRIGEHVSVLRVCILLSPSVAPYEDRRVNVTKSVKSTTVQKLKFWCDDNPENQMDDKWESTEATLAEVKCQTRVNWGSGGKYQKPNK